jgi:hypothetical protein
MLIFSVSFQFFVRQPEGAISGSENPVLFELRNEFAQTASRICTARSECLPYAQPPSSDLIRWCPNLFSCYKYLLVELPRFAGDELETLSNGTATF